MLGHGNLIYLIDQWQQVRKGTVPTMLVQIGRPAIEWLVKEGARHANADEDFKTMKGRRSKRMADDGFSEAEIRAIREWIAIARRREEMKTHIEVSQGATTDSSQWKLLKAEPLKGGSL